MPIARTLPTVKHIFHSSLKLLMFRTFQASFSRMDLANESNKDRHIVQTPVSQETRPKQLEHLHSVMSTPASGNKQVSRLRPLS